jgi:hypothetical protein
MDIDASEVKGEPGTGYEGPEGGPFQCSNCRYFKDGSCGQETMMERSAQPKTADGRVQVDPAGCCEYVDRAGEGESSQNSYASQLAGYAGNQVGNQVGDQAGKIQGGTR